MFLYNFGAMGKIMCNLRHKVEAVCVGTSVAYLCLMDSAIFTVAVSFVLMFSVSCYSSVFFYGVRNSM